MIHILILLCLQLCLHIAVRKYLTHCCKNNVCSRILDPFYIASYCIKWVKTSWTYSNRLAFDVNKCIKVIRYISFHFAYAHDIPMNHLIQEPRVGTSTF